MCPASCHGTYPLLCQSMWLRLFFYLDFLCDCDGSACFFHIRRSTAQVDHGLRQVADYKSLSDTGGSTAAVTRNVWAVFPTLTGDLCANDATAAQQACPETSDEVPLSR